MIELQYPPPAEKVVLSGLCTRTTDKALFEEDMQEMVMLCRTAGAEVLHTFVQRMDRPNASTFIGQGKLLEIKQYMVQKRCGALIMDSDLSPGQIRNIEELIQAKVIDRSQLILDIFAQHARTNEARIQVELAQLKTLYPRLTHAWSHLSQQAGTAGAHGSGGLGIGTRGPGEKQLEVDRRMVQKKISDLNRKLKKIESSRITQRQSRSDSVRLSLVGYTNVGKSSLLNALSGSAVLVENKLFATLDTATKKTFIPGGGSVIISDTVGFLRKLPHHLVASFRSTLEVVNEADILLIVMDASSAWIDQQYATVNEVLAELGAADKERIMIFNKADLVHNPFDRKKISLAYPGSVLVSAFNYDDMALLKETIRETVTGVNREKQKSAIITRETKLASKLPANFLYKHE